MLDKHCLGHARRETRIKKDLIEAEKTKFNARWSEILAIFRLSPRIGGAIGKTNIFQMLNLLILKNLSYQEKFILRPFCRTLIYRVQNCPNPKIGVLRTCA